MRTIALAAGLGAAFAFGGACTASLLRCRSDAVEHLSAEPSRHALIELVARLRRCRQHQPGAEPDDAGAPAP